MTVASEPRVKSASEEISADHPFFWSGYMLIDIGAEPKEEGADPAATPEPPPPPAPDAGVEADNNDEAGPSEDESTEEVSTEESTEVEEPPATPAPAINE